MAKWTLTMAMALAGVMAAGPAFAQATTGGAPASGGETKGEQPKGSATQPDSAGQTPRATNDTSTSGAMKSDTGTADSGTMKSRSGHMRSSRMHKGGMSGHMDQERVKAAQQALKDKGHDPGDVDGRMGPKTHQALRDFQTSQGLQATGRLDAKTMQSLGVEAHTSSTGSSASSGSASPGGSGSSDSGSTHSSSGESKR